MTAQGRWAAFRDRLLNDAAGYTAPQCCLTHVSHFTHPTTLC